MKLSQLLELTGYSTATPIADAEISEIVTDSRKASYNCMFVCLSGSEADGHGYVQQALLKGACCIVAEKELSAVTGGRVNVVVCDNTRLAAARLYSAWYGDPAKKLRLIAVTGTNGKTSVSVMLRSIFEAAFYKCGIIGTVACYSGRRRIFADPDDPLANMTTPDPKQLYRMLAFMAADKVDFVFIEASSHALKLFKLDPIEFECGIFTNVTAEHLDFHGTMEDYLSSKLRLFGMCKRALINADSGLYGRIKDEAERFCETRSYSALGGEADFRALNVKNCGSDGISYTLRSKNNLMEIRSPIPGAFTVDNTLCAASCGLMMGVPAFAVRSALSSLSGVEGRVERIKTDIPVDFSIFIDYAHTPDALSKLLKSFHGMKGENGRIVLLFGCGGNRDRTKRPEMGRIASALADHCVITADNSRSEKTGDIIDGIMSGFDKSRSYEVIEDRRAAIEKVIRDARSGDVIILAGKGHERYEIDQSGKHEFDEKNIALAAVKKYYGK